MICLGGRLAVGLKEEVYQHALDRRRVVADAMMAPGLAGGRVLQPVQRRLASQRRAVASPGCKLARQDSQHRVVAQLVVVDHLLVP